MGHGHAHTTGHAAGRHRSRLAVAFALVGTFFVVELVVGLTSGSLALLSDAGHMAADVVALGAALVATTMATRPDTSGRRTYGSYRAEVFASGLAVLLMLGVAVYVVLEAVARAGASRRCPPPRCWWSVASVSPSTSPPSGCCGPARASRSTCAAPTSRWWPTPPAASG